MPPPLPEVQKIRIQEYLQDGHTPTAISALEGVTDWSVRKIRDNLAAFGTHTRPKGGAKRGAPYKILPSAWDDIRTLVEQKPAIQLKEIQYFVFEEWGVHLSLPHIYRTLKKLKISRRWTRRGAAKRSQECGNGALEDYKTRDAAISTISGTEPPKL